jgi:DNA-binding PucR family transcriptional regulator
LHVHPQTVRYRLGQLRELFGDALDEPEQRFALMLALRLRRGVPGPELEAVRPGIEPTPD